jgi:predicted HicB family RNase H-like nuclease
MTKNRFQEAIRRRDKVKAQVQRIQGKLEAAVSSKEDIDAECRKRGVEPEKLGKAIRKLEKKYEADLATFEASVEQAEDQIAPFLEA